tara:strand:- start:97 stop:900 length:804 start_codon:yes stop_codon:yes gene_type:complete
MKNIKDDKVVLFIGKRETGKSFLVRDLLYYHQNIPIGCIISGTEGANSFYSKIFPSIFIHNEYRPEIIQNFLKRQKLVITQKNEEISNYHRTDIDPRALMILDDCLYDNSWTKDINIRSLFMNGRHYSVMFLLTMQYALGIPPNLRTNVDYVFILREPFFNNRKRLYEHYAGMFPSFEIFCQVMDQCTEDYECLVINNNAKSNRIEDMVFWYKADPHDEFKLGDSVFWEYHNNNYSNRDNNEDEFNVNNIRKRKNKDIINVKKEYQY